MKIAVKILAFLLLSGFISFAGWKFEKEVHKQTDFGDEYIGISKTELFKEFGKPDTIETNIIDEIEGDFKSIFNDFINNCNSTRQVTHLYYDNFWFDYDFWLIEIDEKENVILVR